MSLHTLTTEQLEARDSDVRRAAYVRAALVCCKLCAAGHTPVKGPQGWEHRVWGRDPQGCDAAKIRDLS